jgi:chorismate lyase / 3-hydroxybenzoate synthase
MTSTAPLSQSATASLSVDYLSADALRALSAAGWSSILGVTGFGAVPGFVPADVPHTASFTPSLTGEDLFEVWRVVNHGVTPLAHGESGRVQYRCCDDLLFGCVRIEESALGEASEEQGLMKATELAYLDVFALLERTRYRHLVRIWNYLPDINGEAGGEERYRHFNSARQLAFRGSGRATTGTVPAASGLGSPAGGPLSIYFLASPRPPKMIENPRQTSAYHYPAKFGRHSPIFSRACVWGESGNGRLFISGTASIVGYETVHRDDVSAQTNETLNNIEILIEEANRLGGAGHYTLEGLNLKAYVRHPEDQPAIAAVLAARYPGAQIVYCRADVCREELLVEIEATGAPAGR